MSENNFSCLSGGKGKTYQKKIIVVGAGISGLACAYRLKELGFQNVLILEARNRIGGRTYGIQCGGSNFIEMGAQWIHGEKNNIIYEIAEAKGLIDKDAYDYSKAALNFFIPSEKEVLNILKEFIEENLNKLPENCFPGLSVSKHLDEQFKLFLSRLGPSDLTDSLTDGYELLCNRLLEYNGCQHLSDLSLNMHSEYKDCEGNQLVELKNGYTSILELLLKNIPEYWILTNKTVVNIDWSCFQNENTGSNNFEQKLVKVNCKNNESFLAEHVIVTVPLGYLKRNYLSLFTPRLCKTKEKAIESFGFGTVNKIYFEFEVPFWEAPAVYDVLKRCYENLLKQDSSRAPLGSWVQNINRFAYTPGHPKMLCAWIAGDGAIVMESLSDAEILSNCMPILESIVGKKLDRPIKIIRSTWNSDPYSFGSYSYPSIQSELENVSQSDLAEPEYGNTPCSKHPVLLFAGEATHSYYFSTVHGAYETGLREAERLYEHYRKSYSVSLTSPVDSTPRSMSSLTMGNKNLCKELRIVIVGAGIAGLACAAHLTNNGFTNVTILEAENRIGGRAYTKEFDGKIFELGAQWVHGTNHPLYDYCKRQRHVPHIMEETAWEGKGIFCTSDGKKINQAIVNELKNALDEAKDEIDEGHYNTKEVKSVGAFLSDTFNSYIRNIDGAKVDLFKDLFDWFLKFEIIDNACDNLNDIAVQSFTEWDDCPDEMYRINLNKGFKDVLNSLVTNIPRGSVLLNKPVRTINWLEQFKYENQSGSYFSNRSQDSYPVWLEYGDNEELYADSVIVTASVGFLKENIDTFFSPPLPEKKVRALSKIGFGTVNKMFLLFDEPFWNLKIRGYHFIWKRNGSEKCKQLLKKNPWVKGITGFDVMPNSPNVLLGWIGGKEAKWMEKVDDETILNALTDVLKIFLDSPDIPKPSHIFRSSWDSNPYIRGSYSSRTPEFYAEDCTLQDFQYPLNSTFLTKIKETQWPIVIFSGEATDEHYFSSAHGAFHSGLKAAESLVKKCSEVEVHKKN